MTNIKLIIEYEGTAYGGWQSQINAPTVQDALQRAIQDVSGERVTLYGAGRTDSGVHALGQVANFRTQAPVPPQRWAVAINSHLPDDIRVRESCEAPDRFHAQFSAVGKHYQYTICNRRSGTALRRRTSWYIPQRLDDGAMDCAAQALLGSHDFTAFQSTGGPKRDPNKTVTMARVTRDGDFITFDVAADGFLYNMVRIFVGTLVLVGRGQLQPEAFAAILAGGSRAQAGPRAPAWGLCLMEVFYDDASGAIAIENEPSPQAGT